MEEAVSATGIIIGAGDPNVGGELSGLDFVLTLRESNDVTCALLWVGGACADLHTAVQYYCRKIA